MEGGVDVQGPPTHTGHTGETLKLQVTLSKPTEMHGVDRRACPCPDSLELTRGSSTTRHNAYAVSNNTHSTKRHKCRSSVSLLFDKRQEPVRGLQATTRTHLHDWCRWQRGAATQALRASRHAALKGRHVDGEERSGATKGPGERQGQVCLVVVSIPGVPAECNPNVQRGRLDAGM